MNDTKLRRLAADYAQEAGRQIELNGRRIDTITRIHWHDATNTCRECSQEWPCRTAQAATSDNPEEVVIEPARAEPPTTALGVEPHDLAEHRARRARNREDTP